jgi:hypothetical protein
MELDVYISGKITGEDTLASKVKFLEMQMRLLGMDVHTVTNPHLLGITDKWPWDKAMDKCLEVLSKGHNTIIMLNDYADSKGALRELEMAEKLGLLIVFEHQVDDLYALAKAKFKNINTPTKVSPKQTWRDTSNIEFP